MASTIDATVVAIFEEANNARAAVGDLKSSGVGSDHIFVSSESGVEGANPELTHPHHEGGIKGWFKSLFGSEPTDQSRGYERAVAAGRTIVSVDTSEADVDRVSDILNRHSPVEVHPEEIGTASGVATPNVYDAGYEGSRSDKLNARDELGIPVVKEEMKVGKRTVLRGGVRVYSRFSETPIEENVRLREEHVRVERTPVNRPATQADLNAGRDQVIEVPEYAEEPVVAKEARVVEEVRVSKNANETNRTVRDTVRSNDVHVDKLDTRDASVVDRSRSGEYGDDSDYRQHFAATYPAGNYEDYAPAYRYGSEIANDPRYQGRSYSEIEPDIRQDYARRYPNSLWDRVQGSVRYGWDKVTGKTHSATTSR